MAIRNGWRFASRSREVVLKSTRAELKRALRLESLEERRVMDSAMSAAWNERLASASADRTVDESTIEAWKSEMVDQLVSQWGLGRMVSSQEEIEISFDVMEDPALDQEAYSLRVGDFSWDVVLEDGVPKLMESESRQFHNYEEPADINGDDYVNSIDALVAINALNRNGAMMLPSRGEGASMDGMLDPNGDGWVTAMDALFVINRLNSESGSDPGFDNGSGNGSGDGSGGDGDSESGGGDSSRGGGGSEGGGSEGGGDAPSAVDDYVNKFLPSGTVSFPSIEIDVLANDPSGLGIKGYELAALGEVEIVVGAGPEGRDVMRYTPGPTFRGNDSFLYTAMDSSGNSTTARVFIEYYQDQVPFQVVVPEVIQGLPGEGVKLVDGDGKPLVMVGYSGSDVVNVGVYLNWAAPEKPYAGNTFSGSFISPGFDSESGFYDAGRGAAWIYGSVDQVNRILASLIYEPAPGFVAPNGAGVSVYAFLYNALGLKVSTASAGFVIKVPEVPNSPKAADDEYQMKGNGEVFLIDVIANDVDFDGSKDGLEIVDVRAGNGWASSLIELDKSTGKIKYSPSPFFNGLDEFAYTIRNRQGLFSQGIVRVVKGS